MSHYCRYSLVYVRSFLWNVSMPILAYPSNNNQVSKCSQRVSLLTLCRILHGVASGCDGNSSTSTLPSSNTIQTAGFLWLLTFNSLGTHGGRCPSNCLDPGFSNVCCCLPCCPPQSKHMALECTTKRLSVNWSRFMVRALCGHPFFPTISNTILHSSLWTLFTLIATSILFRLDVSLYIDFSQSKQVFYSLQAIAMRCLFPMWTI